MNNRGKNKPLNHTHTHAHTYVQTSVCDTDCCLFHLSSYCTVYTYEVNIATGELNAQQPNIYTCNMKRIREPLMSAIVIYIQLDELKLRDTTLKAKLERVKCQRDMDIV